jgi:hypothetical protein
MRESRLYGSVRGARGNSRPYRERVGLLRLLTAACGTEGAAIIEADNVERVLTDIDADYRNRSLCGRRHGVLLVLAPLASLSLAGQEHGRTIPLADLRPDSGNFSPPSGLPLVSVADW